MEKIVDICLIDFKAYNITFDKAYNFSRTILLSAKTLNYLPEELIFEKEYVVITYKSYKIFISNISIEDAIEKAMLIGSKVAIYLNKDKIILKIYVKNRWEDLIVDDKIVNSLISKEMLEAIYLCDNTKFLTYKKIPSFFKKILKKLNIDDYFIPDFITLAYFIKKSFNGIDFYNFDLNNKEILKIAPRNILESDIEKFKEILNKNKDSNYLLYLQELLLLKNISNIINDIFLLFNKEAILETLKQTPIPRLELFDFLLVDFAIKQTLNMNINIRLNKDSLLKIADRFLKNTPKKFISFFDSKDDAILKLKRFISFIERLEDKTLNVLIKLASYITDLDILNDYFLKNNSSNFNIFYQTQDIENSITHIIDQINSQPINKEEIVNFLEVFNGIKNIIHFKFNKENFKKDIKNILQEISKEHLNEFSKYFINEEFAIKKLLSVQNSIDKATNKELEAYYKINQIIYNSNQNIINDIINTFKEEKNPYLKQQEQEYNSIDFNNETLEKPVKTTSKLINNPYKNQYQYTNLFQNPIISKNEI